MTIGNEITGFDAILNQELKRARNHAERLFAVLCVLAILGVLGVVSVVSALLFRVARRRYAA